MVRTTTASENRIEIRMFVSADLIHEDNREALVKMLGEDAFNAASVHLKEASHA